MGQRNLHLKRYPSLLVADVHATPSYLHDILRAVPSDIKKVFLGDAVGYGNDPVTVVEMLDEFDLKILGNHDSIVIGQNDPALFVDKARESILDHTRALGKEGLIQLLEGYQLSYSEGGIVLCHGTPEDPNEYLFNEDDIKQILENNPEAEMLVGGHLHIPRVARMSKDDGEITFCDISMPVTSVPINLEKFRYVVNCPSAAPGRFQYDQVGYCMLIPETGKKMNLNFHFICPSCPEGMTSHFWP